MMIPNDVLKSRGIRYVQKFPYGEIARTTRDKKRHYETPDGRVVPSVTTVLSATKDMTHLHAWRKRIGVQKAQQITTESANIGTVMHRSLEKHVKGEDRTPGSNLIQQKAHTMANVINCVHTPKHITFNMVLKYVQVKFLYAHRLTNIKHLKSTTTTIGLASGMLNWNNTTRQSFNK